MEMVPNPVTPPLTYRSPSPTQQRIKLLRVEIYFFLLNYCQYCLHGFLVKIALEYRGDSRVHQFEEQSEKLTAQKVERRKAAEGYEVRGLDIISVPTFTFDRLATQTRSHATPPWLCDFGERQE